MSYCKYFNFLVCVLCFCSDAVFAEATNKIDFTVYVGTTKAGALFITRQERNEKVTYHLHSEVSVKLLVGIDVEENIQDVFVNGLLHESEHTRFINASQRIKNSLRYTQQQYVLSKNDKTCGYLTTTIRTSVTSLYFMEPTLPVQVYSQSFQKLITLKRTGTHSYLLKLPNGSTTEYHYERGDLVRVISNNAWGEVRFERN